MLSTSLFAAEVDYITEVQPLLTKYCAGCHGGAEPDGGLSLESFDALLEGGEHGPALLAGEAETSRLLRLISGAGDPKMPPEDEPAPNADEISLLTRWVAEGAKGPAGAMPDRLRLITPAIATQTDTRPIADITVTPDGKTLAVARFQQVELRPVAAGPVTGSGQPRVRTVGVYPGKVNAVHFSTDASQLVTASGVTGLGGVAAIWSVNDGTLLREFKGHRDALYDAELSPDGRILATCSYDREIILWDVTTGEELRKLTGHNGAVYDVAFSPDGAFLASASADDTCKVWRVADGERMDTLGQPLKEQYSITFSPDGQFIAAGGADNRIRVWRFVSTDKPRINPLVFARFAHEGAVVRIAFTTDGTRLVSLADDRTLKVWETAGYTELSLSDEPAVAAALAVSTAGNQIHIGRLDGSLGDCELTALRAPAASTNAPSLSPVPMEAAAAMEQLTEQEPNSTPRSAQPIALPAKISGVIGGTSDTSADRDCFRFSARAGEEWVIEVNAARSKSPLDSFVEVLTDTGESVERVRLQAVRDSYFTFRGKNGDESGDFRVFNWEEMELNQYLYANGEVARLWMYPRGPDSGFLVYPGGGKRWGYFGTTPVAHALGEPCYIVEPLPTGTEPIPNGLPVFPIHYENDDDSTRELGADSRLTFLTPEDGEYVVRLSDVRGFEGDDFKYTLTVRPSRPDFKVTVNDQNPTVPAGGGREFKVTVDRIDGYDGPVTVEFDNLPTGFRVAAPVTIEPGQMQAFGLLLCAADAPEVAEAEQSASRSRSMATIRGEAITHEGGGLGKITRGEPAKLDITIVPAANGAQPVETSPEGYPVYDIRPGRRSCLS
ncbi:MAG: c-type cytochrome domain-containing protein [Planctomycetaceae bacterium]